MAKQHSSIRRSSIIHPEKIPQMIFLVRGHKVILDRDLAKLYGVPTKALNQAVKRNQSRFPDDFIFKLSRTEKKEVVTNCDHLKVLRFSSMQPYAFTEHGALMVASVLNSSQAVRVSIYIVRTFIRLRELAESQTKILKKLVELERKLGDHDQEIQSIFDAIRQLMMPPEKSKRKIGFNHESGIQAKRRS